MRSFTINSRKSIFKLVFTLILIAGLSSCEDELPTQAELNAEQIRQAIDRRAVDAVFTTSSDGVNRRTRVYNDPSLRIEGTFFIVDNDFYSLDKMIRFSFQDDDLFVDFE